MNHCRNCGGSALHELGFVGELAPFFLKRVHRVELVTRISPDPLKRLIQKLTKPVQPLISRIHPVVAAVELQSCLSCSFVQTRFLFLKKASPVCTQTIVPTHTTKSAAATNLPMLLSPITSATIRRVVSIASARSQNGWRIK